MTSEDSGLGGRRRRDAVATRTSLIYAARTVTCTAGVAGASARLIASEAGVNQALIFYHFHTVAELIETASNHFVDAAISDYRDQLTDIATVTELVDLARQLHTVESNTGNIAFMAQIIAGADQHPAIHRAATYAVTTWTNHVRSALTAVLAGTVMADLVDIGGLARLVTASLIGIELSAAITDPEPAFATLTTIGALADTIANANPVTRKIIAAAARR